MEPWDKTPSKILLHDTITSIFAFAKFTMLVSDALYKFTFISTNIYSRTSIRQSFEIKERVGTFTSLQHQFQFDYG